MEGKMCEFMVERRTDIHRIKERILPAGVEWGRRTPFLGTGIGPEQSF